MSNTLGSEIDLDQQVELNIQPIRALASAITTLAAQAETPNKQQLIKQLLVVTNQSAICQSNDVINPVKAAISPLLATIGYENPGLICRHIDISTKGSDGILKNINHELYADSIDTNIAYRIEQLQIKRQVRCLKPQAINQDILSQPTPIINQGLYLITGGLGGIGKRLIAQLSNHYNANVIVIGRRSEQELDLSELPDNSLYLSADISCEAQTQQVWDKAQKHFNKTIDGVFHLAGVLNQSLISEQSSAQFSDAIAAKFKGAWHLHQQLVKQQNPNSLFVGFSSVNALFGGFAASAYSVANACVEGIIAMRKQQGFTNSYALSWTQWQQIGMSDTNLSSAQLKAQGLFAIEAPKGDKSIFAALQIPNQQLTDGTVLIGLDGSTTRIQQLISSAEHVNVSPAEQMIAWYSQPPSSNNPQIQPSQIQLPQIADSFAQQSDIQLKCLEKLPTTKDGNIDKQALLALNQQHLQANKTQINYVAPANKLERIIAGVWSQVLGKEDIGVHHGFFEIGGQSVLLVQVRSKLSQMLSKDISVVELLRYPTISTLAKHLGSNDKGKKDFSTAKDRAALSRNRKRKTVRPSIRPRSKR